MHNEYAKTCVDKNAASICVHTKLILRHVHFYLLTTSPWCVSRIVNFVMPIFYQAKKETPQCMKIASSTSYVFHLKHAVIRKNRAKWF